MQKFKKLVAGLFDSVMEEIGLAEEELVELIAQGLESKNKNRPENSGRFFSFVGNQLWCPV